MTAFERVERLAQENQELKRQLEQAERRHKNDDEAIAAYKDERDWLEKRLEQAERERDEAKERTRQADGVIADMLDEREVYENQLASVPALAEALKWIRLGTQEPQTEKIAGEALATWEQE